MQRTVTGFPLVTIVKVFLRHGNVFTMRCPREEDTLAFAKTLEALWMRRYTSEEIAARDRVVPVLSLFLSLFCIFSLTILVLWRTLQPLFSSSELAGISSGPHLQT